jgi:hypothetical protein
VWDDDRRVGDESWHDSQPLVLASGVAALALVGLLVFAVMRVSDNSVDPPDIRYPDTSASTTESSFTTPTSTTSYTSPSVQTSEFTPPPPAPPPDAPSEGGDQPSPVDTPTTIYNPYAPAPTSGSAGHI